MTDRGCSTLVLVNFSHPLTPSQREAVETLSGRPIDRLVEVAVQFDHAQSFAGQVRDSVDAAGLTPEEWQSVRLLVILPSLSAAAGAVLAEIHGRCGYFPSIVRLRPAANDTPPHYEVAEILHLQSQRDQARTQR